MIKNESGQSLVELALILPLLLLLLVGTIDFGRVLYMQSHLHLATQETVRVGGLGASDAEIITFARNYVHVGDKTSLHVLISPNETSRKSGEYVTVKLQYPIDFFTPFLSKIIPPTFTLSAQSTIRVE